jgi:hypothetical protein|tara:strand:+ start:209 stop:763 length:555 start_codon:yes stop_codon:yes gene_type:complete
MSDEFIEVCSICHENMNIIDDNNEMYELPECKHYFHTNCILTWFRAGHNRCPLCNNEGLNNNNMSMNLINNTLDNYSWQYKRKLLNENYVEMRNFSRKKNAPKKLKKKIEKLKKQEERYKIVAKEVNEFLNSKPENMKVTEIISKVRILRGKKWVLMQKISKMKTYIGLSNPVINIIIPKKVEV